MLSTWVVEWLHSLLITWSWAVGNTRAVSDLRWSPEALSDLESIRDFIARDSPHYAQLLVHKLVAATEQLTSFPNSGRVVPEFGDETLRELIVGAYRIVYRCRGGTVEVATVFQGNRLYPGGLR